jgi:hypothetical protein
MSNGTTQLHSSPTPARRLSFAVSDCYYRWLRRFSKTTGSSVADLLTEGLSALARDKGHELPPARLARRSRFGKPRSYRRTSWRRRDHKTTTS